MTPYNFKRLEIFLYNYDNKVTISNFAFSGHGQLRLT